MTKNDLNTAFKIFKRIVPNLNENFQVFDKEYKHRYSHLVYYVSKNKIVAVWLDFEVLNKYKLEYLFKNHSQIKSNFFVQQIDNFYRVGWKL